MIYLTFFNIRCSLMGYTDY